MMETGIDSRVSARTYIPSIIKTTRMAISPPCQALSITFLMERSIYSAWLKIGVISMPLGRDFLITSSCFIMLRATMTVFLSDCLFMRITTPFSPFSRTISLRSAGAS